VQAPRVGRISAIPVRSPGEPRARSSSAAIARDAASVSQERVNRRVPLAGPFGDAPGARHGRVRRAQRAGSGTAWFAARGCSGRGQASTVPGYVPRNRCPRRHTRPARRRRRASQASTTGAGHIGSSGGSQARWDRSTRRSGRARQVAAPAARWVSAGRPPPTGDPKSRGLARRGPVRRGFMAPMLGGGCDDSRYRGGHERARNPGDWRVPFADRMIGPWRSRAEGPQNHWAEVHAHSGSDKVPGGSHEPVNVPIPQLGWS
jgi:hypothetical protein